jgi:diadenosine tetraphosphatase ApaH/serine/threonine PP2A family protein phosphatase
VVGGPEPAATLDRLMALDGAHFVRGNADRGVVEAFDESRGFDPAEPDPGRKASAWDAERITREQRDFLAGFAERVVLEVAGLGEVLVCHATPRSDEEIITSLTSDADLRGIFRAVEQDLVVCGHTHRQYDRTLDALRIVNAGSVGMPYQAPGGAFWLVLGPGVELRRTDYDRERAAAHLHAIGDYWYAETHAEVLLAPPDYEETFERMAAAARS